MKYLLMILIALSFVVVVPAMALESGEYVIESQESLILISVSENESVVDEVFFEGSETVIKFSRVSDNGNNGRVFGIVDDRIFYVIFDIEKDVFNVKIWDGKETTKSFQSLEVQSIF